MYFECLKLHNSNFDFSEKVQIVRVNSDRNGGKYDHGRQLSWCYNDAVVIIN